jgi:hypothetical protein
MGNMTEAQFLVLLGTVLAGVIWQRVDTHQLSGRIDRLSDDMRQFYRTLGQHDAKIENLEKRLGS